MKKILSVLLVSTLLMTLTGCNKQVLDLTYNYQEAILQLPNGQVIEGKVESWTDYGDGDQIQVKFANGKTYLAHSTDVVLIAK